jgi:DNA-binding XRE family transcriptional regulator
MDNTVKLFTMNIKQYTSGNLQFLRNSISVSVLELAERLNVDPIDIYLIEKGMTISEINRNGLIELLCALGMYFTVQLADIYFTDLEHSIGYDSTIAAKLIDEANGLGFNRKHHFRELVMRDSEDYTLSAKQTEEDRLLVMRDAPAIIHRTYCLEERYFYLRRTG